MAIKVTESNKLKENEPTNRIAGALGVDGKAKEALETLADPLGLFTQKTLDTTGLEQRAALGDQFARDLANYNAALGPGGPGPSLGLDVEKGITRSTPMPTMMSPNFENAMIGLYGPGIYPYGGYQHGGPNPFAPPATPQGGEAASGEEKKNVLKELAGDFFVDPLKDAWSNTKENLKPKTIAKDLLIPGYAPYRQGKQAYKQAKKTGGRVVNAAKKLWDW